MIRFIINADDYGTSKQVNEGISSLFKKRIISRTTMIVNYKQNSESSIKMAIENGFINFVGLHINIYDGEPLTNNIMSCPDFVTNGVFNHKYRSSYKRFVLFSKKTKEALANEFDAQFKLFKKLTGASCSFHFDSHHHIHTEPAIWRILKRVAKNNGFKSTRISQNIFSKDYKRNVLKNIYKYFFNKSVKRHFVSTEYFCSAHDFLNQRKAKKIKNCTVEIMCHPVFTHDKHFVNELEFDEICRISSMAKEST